MNKKNVWSFVFVTIFFLIGFLLLNNSSKNLIPEKIKQVKIAGQDIRVDLALTPIQKMNGLSGRPYLGQSEGMLFVFDYPYNYSFWMKDMNFPIDIIWLNQDLKVVYIKKDAQPKSYPETYGPPFSVENALYVLEVYSGFSEKNNLKIGDTVYFTN